MKRNVDMAFTAALVLCALTMTAVLVRREFLLPAASLISVEQQPRFVKAWQVDLSHGVHFGNSNAPVQLIEFSDFECPYCREFERVLKPLRNKYSTQIGLTYVHFPIPGHRFAIPAARAAECAGDQGRSESMHDRLFELQDQFGLKPWTDMAEEAGVPDIPAFEICMSKTDPVPRVSEGQVLGKQLDIQGTPTVIINGWKLGRPPTEQELDGMVKAILAGRSPVTSDGKFAQ
jgi:protein-disulfide isomerase